MREWGHLVPNVFPSSSQCVLNAIHMEFHKLCPKSYSQNLYKWAEGTHLLYFYLGVENSIWGIVISLI
jgi:hypothetical protein